MKRNAVLSLLASFILMTLITQAQSTPACSPKSCGPENTKTKEAKVIASMRGDLQVIIDRLAKMDGFENTEITTLDIAPGATDDESLENIYAAALAIREVILKNTQTEKISPELLKDVSAYDTKQQMVAQLQTEIQLISDHVSRQ